MILFTLKRVAFAGNYISVYNLRDHPSSRFWSVARNEFHRPLHLGAANWQFHETLTTDAPHSYNMGVVQEAWTVNSSALVRLSPRMGPPPGATLLVLGGSGAGQSRLVTGRGPDGSYAIDRPFDEFLAANQSMVAAIPTIGQKLVVGNLFKGASVVQVRQA